jgi:hypothetical protein
MISESTGHEFETDHNSLMNFYTLDRMRSLHVGQVIALEIFNDVEPAGLNEHVNMMFPKGVSKHGELYFLRPSPAVGDPALGVSPAIELLFEYVRRSAFPERPSRFQSLFAFDSEQESVQSQAEFGDGIVWQVEAEQSFRADMRLLSLGSSILVASWNAHEYWSGKRNGQVEPCWERLLVPPVKVIREL